ncbi:MAG TPA: selenocysteine-specific translation elongation factor [Gemmatimonadales bacterium]
MDRHVVIGTAGHVDHGKTALVKALTGTDTDRLAEEKRRGITIDLGFAAMDLAPGLKASVVDVPGHEDFVRNMVAGATGVDVALLIIAADESIMPQTVEHLAILEFLGVAHGVVALTKADLVEPAWLDLVRADIVDRLAKTAVQWEAIDAVSVVDGRGIEALKGHLATAAARAATRDASDLFRLPVDRVFSVAGAGTVVTGTTWSGSVRVGDEVRVFPGALTARVRSVEVHGRPAASAEPGRRTALALVGLDKAAVARGSVVVAGEGWRETPAIDVAVTLLPGSRPLSQRTRVRLHHGTAEVIARVTPAGADIPPGGQGVVRLRLEAPLLARWGDRAVLRAYSPVTTIGGAVVIDPLPPARPRRPDANGGKANASVTDRLTAFVAAEGKSGLAVGDLPVRLGVHHAAWAGAVQAATAVARLGPTLVPIGRLAESAEAAKKVLGTFHKANPLEPGMRRDAFRDRLGGGALGEALEALLARDGKVVADGGVVRLPTHKARLTDADRESLGPALLEQLKAAALEGRTAAELAESLKSSEPKVAELAEFFIRERRAGRVGRDRYYDRDALARAVALTRKMIEESGSATPAQLRDSLGLTRKYLIPLLEWMDAQGHTIRAGDVRRLGAKAHLDSDPGA